MVLIKKPLDSFREPALSEQVRWRTRYRRQRNAVVNTVIDDIQHQVEQYERFHSRHEEALAIQSATVLVQSKLASQKDSSRFSPRPQRSPYQAPVPSARGDARVKRYRANSNSASASANVLAPAADVLISKSSMSAKSASGSMDSDTASRLAKYRFARNAVKAAAASDVKSRTAKESDPKSETLSRKLKQVSFSTDQLMDVSQISNVPSDENEPLKIDDLFGDATPRKSQAARSPKAATPQYSISALDDSSVRTDRFSSSLLLNDIEEELRIAKLQSQYRTSGRSYVASPAVSNRSTTNTSSDASDGQKTCETGTVVDVRTQSAAIPVSPATSVVRWPSPTLPSENYTSLERFLCPRTASSIRPLHHFYRLYFDLPPNLDGRNRDRNPY